MKKNIFWTAEEIALFKELYPITPVSDLLILFQQRFKRPFCHTMFKNAATRYHVKKINNGCFKKNHIAWNKGTKGLTFRNKTTFTKGKVTVNNRPVGSERVEKSGYIKVKIGEPSVWQLKHVFCWEHFHGQKLPKGFVVIFADQDKSNFSSENLVKISRGLLATLNRKGLIFNNIEATKCGITMASITQKVVEINKN